MKATNSPAASVSYTHLVQGRLQYDEFYALKDVSLDIMPGDFYGLVGLNGSGKSTLLKTIAVSYTHLDVYKRQGLHHYKAGGRDSRNGFQGAAAMDGHLCAGYR